MNQSERNSGGMTALHLAAARGDKEKVEQLLHAGANPNQLNDERQPPLFSALQLTLADGPDVISKREALFRLLWDATTPEIRLAQDHEGNTILQLMAVYGFDLLARETIEKAPQLASSYMNFSREYPIHTAILNGQLNVAEALFELDPNTSYYKNVNDQSALHYAARYGSADMVELCCKHRTGDIDEKDRLGKTPLTWAKEENGPTIQAYLMSQGADESVCDSRTTTIKRPGY